MTTLTLPHPPASARARGRRHPVRRVATLVPGRHAYTIEGNQRHAAVLAGQFDKALHVSPFMGMDHRYDARGALPAQTLSIHISSSRAGATAFDATLALRRRELTRASIARITARYPRATVRVLALIYAHALGRKLAGVPVHRHPQAGPA